MVSFSSTPQLLVIHLTPALVVVGRKPGDNKMKNMVKKIAVLGDFNPGYSTHHALNDSIRTITKMIDGEIQFDWIGTDIFDPTTAFKNLYCGLWIAPGSPYINMENVLNAITYARENNIPTLGNCGGFQHMVIEFARNVCGIANAGHEETNPGAEDLVIAKLSCSLVEQQEELTLVDTDSILYNAIQRSRLVGKYYCSYGLNSRYIDTLTSHGLSLTAITADGQIRAFEIKKHPFFVGTLFQPALTSTMEEPDPVITAFVNRSMQG